MDIVVSASGKRGPRGSQDETSPFLLEFMVARPLGQSQDETSPFPLDFVVVARERRARQDETAPFPLEYQVKELESDAESVRVERVERSIAEPQPRRAVSDVQASAQLRDYAARVAAGEALPPYRGPILASEERARAVVPGPAEPSSDPGKAIVKLALGVMLMMAALVAAAVGGDDAALRAAGAAIGGWFTGNDGSFERFPLDAAQSAPFGAARSVPLAASPCNERPVGAVQKP